MADRNFVGDDNRSSPEKYRDMGDGTYARVIFNLPPGGASDLTIVGEDGSSIPRKLKDKGDGTFAVVVRGVNF